MDESEDLHTNRTNICFHHYGSWGRGLRSRKTSLAPFPTPPPPVLHYSLRKHAYANIWKITPPKTENIQIKNSDIFLISAQNIDCGYSLEPPPRGGSNEYPLSMFLSRNKKTNVHPCKPPQFYYIKVGCKGVNII